MTGPGLIIVANLIRNGCGIDELTHAKILWPRPFFCIASPTILATSATMHKIHLPRPLNLEIYRQKQCSIIILYTKVKLVPHPFCAFIRSDVLSLAGQPLRKREEGSGVMPIRDLYRCSQECSPIRFRHVTTSIVELSKYSG